MMMKPKAKKNRLLESQKRIEMNSAVKRGELPKPTNSRNCRVVVVLIVCIISSILIYSKVFHASPVIDELIKEVEDISHAYIDVWGSTKNISSPLISKPSTSSSVPSISSPLISIPSTSSSVPSASHNPSTTPANTPLKPIETNLLEMEHLLLEYTAQIDDTLQWIINNFDSNRKKYGRLDKKSKQQVPFYTSFSHFANIEIHLMHKLRKFLKSVLPLKGDIETNKNVSATSRQKSLQSVYDLMKNGYQCKPVHAAQQELISKYIYADICSEIEWYKLAQLAWPDARHIVDVGANKGYLGSLFMVLWGGGGLGLSPAVVFETSERLRSWRGSRNPAGYCKDGYNAGVQMYCPPPFTRDKKTSMCNMLNADVRVSSFDGSSFLAGTINKFLTKEIPKPTVISKAGQSSKLQFTDLWEYNHNAVADAFGLVNFTKQSQEKNAGYEGGSIISAGREGVTELEEVKVITIDGYLQTSKHIIGGLDILKIDAEGFDNKVLVGAAKAIKESVGLFTFEGGKGIVLSKEMLDTWDAQGFSCYSTSRAGLFKWNGGCMPEKFMGGFSAKDKGNIFCASRFRAPLVALSFDVLSFPMLVEQYFTGAQYGVPGKKGGQLANKHTPAELKKLQQVMNEGTASEMIAKVDQSQLLPLYINIHQFCTPWPACLK